MSNHEIYNVHKQLVKNAHSLAQDLMRDYAATLTLMDVSVDCKLPWRYADQLEDDGIKLREMHKIWSDFNAYTQRLKFPQ